MLAKKLRIKSYSIKKWTEFVGACNDQVISPGLALTVGRSLVSKKEILKKLPVFRNAILNNIRRNHSSGSLIAELEAAIAPPKPVTKKRVKVIHSGRKNKPKPKQRAEKPVVKIKNASPPPSKEVKKAPVVPPAAAKTERVSRDRMADFNKDLNS